MDTCVNIFYRLKSQLQSPYLIPIMVILPWIFRELLPLDLAGKWALISCQDKTCPKLSGKRGFGGRRNPPPTQSHSDLFIFVIGIPREKLR